MNFFQLLNHINTEQFSDEGKDKFLSRKDALGKLSNFSKKLALSAVPLGAISAFSNPAIAQTDDRSIEDVLNFALTLELLEAEYYQTGLDSGVVVEDAQTIYQTINDHEQDHVAFLQDTINSIDGEPVSGIEFDFTAGGAFNPFEDYQVFLTLSQAFEDTGVRAYKGQAGFLQSNDAALTAALQVHSVEARHAAEVRRLRGLNGWITGGPEDEGVPPAAEAVYEGEDQVEQAGVGAGTISGGDGNIDNGDITEGWDEPLTTNDVLAIADLFIVDNSDDSDG